MPTIRKCECGREYEITQHKLSMPDPDRFECECGKELLRWKSNYTFTVVLIKDIARIKGSS
ncbi:MAG TPA: hypothetical protein VKZ53_14665 [Candidatus Angelobacter sp.]|nr:hypothetical protein [Candidatus Angelobacter sp.]